jgi:site-specific DNA-methyltransferase (adenine-specific)
LRGDHGPLHDEVATPDWLFEKLDEEFHFTWDVAASRDLHRCEGYYTEEDDALGRPWDGEVCWCNPPFSEAAKWADKAVAEARAGATVVMVINTIRVFGWSSATVLKRFDKAELRIIPGRARFRRVNGDAVELPVCVAILRPGLPGPGSIGLWTGDWAKVRT